LAAFCSLKKAMPETEKELMAFVAEEAEGSALLALVMAHPEGITGDRIGKELEQAGYDLGPNFYPTQNRAMNLLMKAGRMSCRAARQMGAGEAMQAEDLLYAPANRGVQVPLETDLKHKLIPNEEQVFVDINSLLSHSSPPTTLPSRFLFLLPSMFPPL
jgi:hypothetical protein